MVTDWLSTLIECERCDLRWMAAHPNCERLECPACGYMMQVPAVVESGIFIPPDGEGPRGLLLGDKIK